ncbi:Peptidoglycan/LPS O-acetylase OafA/YrhL, contains acyltransferase and SGNH-hydrolase domains [Singulisphaera sp. GP187]|uniref:acyltransferase family protein n=1 Tax=Singulisphaera sp. GP187 TaxID=1882752 RepID=UPI00092CD818|nr:acyltransferase [Singulisphaera sp. GP187]SIO55076.1 Peptidoglycan/LPS O-acetylase OafA/YrhL, contains acyltransferase and SGNH-hydrolase domains [Singulisphaera sp. GP187]
MNSPSRLPRHFYSLDALRGFASLAVIFSHWDHFFYHGTKQGSFSPNLQPLYQLFWPFYNEGGRAVDLFFCLSGFIFFWLYSLKIRRGEVSFRDFFLLRFSRLYPLHFVTLLLVAAGQYVFYLRHRTFFVYPYNDLYHFFIQLFFASHWGIHRGYSFNAPVWSVSIEVMLYFIFFVLCRLGIPRWWQLTLLALAGMLVMLRVNHDLGNGLCSFFMGGLSFYAVSHLCKVGCSPRVTKVLVLVTLLAWIAVPALVSYLIPLRIYRASFPSGDPTIFGKQVLALAVTLSTPILYNCLLFPLTVTTLAMVESWWGAFAKRLSFLGHISYSSYLLHFPLQLGFVLVGPPLSPESSFYYSPVSLLLFFSLLVPLSLATYWYFERPAQSFLRFRLQVSSPGR